MVAELFNAKLHAKVFRGGISRILQGRRLERPVVDSS